MTCRNVYRDYYSSPGTRAVCHDVKGGSGLYYKKEAVRTIASAFIGSGILAKGDILIPAPQHTGRATYMREIAEKVASAADCEVCDILLRDDTSTLYGKDMAGRRNSLKMYLDSICIPEGRLVFVDNVISTGTTYRAAKRLLGDKLVLLTYAVDYSSIIIK